RELARWIEAQPVFVEAVSTARAAGRPIVPVRYLVGERDGPRAPEDPEASEAECRDLAWLARELGLPPGELDSSVRAPTSCASATSSCTGLMVPSTFE
ncbi:hypothetical protein, partial [Arthrobacter agilis]|uniref:hypothetical protein n=1 Tax=Arthrobacter agilis TaxID=37921 RepID=UPI0013051792